MYVFFMFLYTATPPRGLFDSKTLDRHVKTNPSGHLDLTPKCDSQIITMSLFSNKNFNT